MNAFENKRATLLASLALLLVLGGCNRPEDRTASQRLDTGATAAKARRADVNAKRDAKLSSGSTAASAHSTDSTNAGSTQADSPRAMGAPAGGKVNGAAITARVNASLARDRDLSAIRIDVDTQDGVVTLSGLAPS